MTKKYYDTLQIRCDKEVKEQFREYCELKGTTPSAMLKEFMNRQIQALWREKRKTAEGVDTADFLG